MGMLGIDDENSYKHSSRGFRPSRKNSLKTISATKIASKIKMAFTSLTLAPAVA